jgi:hypothetical protein
MIRLIEGRPGAGKTLVLVTKLLQIRKRNPKKRIYTNFSFGEFDEDGKLAVPYSTIIHTWDEFGRLKDGIVAIDESSIWAPSEQNKTLPREQRIQLKQHRKGGLEVWLTDQSYEHTAKVIRDMVAQVFTLNRFGPFIIADGRDPISLKPFGRMYFTLREEVFQYYRTDEYIGDAYSGEGYGFSDAEKWRPKKEKRLEFLRLTTERELTRLELLGTKEAIGWRYSDKEDKANAQLRRAGWIERV